MNRVVRLALAALMTATAGWALACRDVSGPEGDVFSISGLLLPSPGLVVGDTMRDSAGAAAPLRVVAYDVAGDTLANVTPSFVLLDSGAHLAGTFLVGDSSGASVRIVGSVGALQTQPTAVKVTQVPDSMTAADSTRHRTSYSLISGDTVVHSADLATRVLGILGGGVEAVIVRYTIDRMPAGSGTGGPTVVLMNGSVPSTRDTTDAGGRAALRARLRLAALSAFETDTAIVGATSSYRGRILGTVQFTVIFTRQ